MYFISCVLWFAHDFIYTCIYAKFWFNRFSESEYLVISYPCMSQTSAAVNISVNFTIEYLISDFINNDDFDQSGHFTITTSNIPCEYFEQWSCSPTTCVRVALWLSLFHFLMYNLKERFIKFYLLNWWLLVLRKVICASSAGIVHKCLQFICQYQSMVKF